MSESTAITEEDIREILAEIDDPEMPISIVDLGIIAQIDVGPKTVTVQVTPTYTGCPALAVIEDEIRQRVAAVVGERRVNVVFVFDPPWNVQRISERGRARLESHGITLPNPQPQGILVRCPYCGSERTRVDSPFGPTRCKQIYYCEACHNPFEHIK